MPGRRVRRRSAALTFLGLLAVSACSLFGGPGVVPPASMTLSIENGTTIPVLLVVNGSTIETLQPQQAETGIPASRLPPLPWAAEVRTTSGRQLLAMTVHAGDVVQINGSDGGGSSQGDGARVDLSCGRIDLWSGPPMLGPAPGPGTPGDCDP